MPFHFRVVVADPPWPMEWRGGADRRKNGRGVVYRSAVSSHKSLPYPTMTVDDIAALDVSSVTDQNAALFLWSPDKFVIDGSATQVCEEWGFEPQRFIVWAKRGYGLGTFPRPQHELILFGKRGRLERGHAGVRKHSAKPPDFLAMVESVYPGPYLELFARTARLGWSHFGNEALEDPDLTTALTRPLQEHAACEVAR